MNAQKDLGNAWVYFPPFSKGILTSVFYLSGYSNYPLKHSSGMKKFSILFPKDVRVYRKEFELCGAREGVCKSKSRCISNLVVKALCREEVKPSSQSCLKDNVTALPL